MSCKGRTSLEHALSRVIWSSRQRDWKPGSRFENSTINWTVRIVVSVMCRSRQLFELGSPKSSSESSFTFASIRFRSCSDGCSNSS